MFKNFIFIFLFYITFPLLLAAQCTDSKSFKERLLAKDFIGLSPIKQLHELLNREAATQYCAHRNDSCRILLLQSISKLYRSVGENSRAIYYISKAINIATNNSKSVSVNPSCQIENYYYLGRQYDLLKKNSEKVAAYDSCIAVSRRLNINNMYFIIALLAKVQYLNDNGDYHLCISQATQGEIFSRNYIPGKGQEQYGDSTWFLLSFAHQKINALITLQKYKEAQACLISQLEKSKTGNGRQYFGTFCEQLALTKIQQKEFDAALGYFNQALNHYKQLNDTLSYRNNLHNIGYLYEMKGDNEKVLYYYKRSLHYVARNVNRRRLDSLGAVAIYSDIGNVFAHQRKFDSAQCYFKYAFNHIKQGTNESEVLNSSLDEFISNQNENFTNLFVNKGNAFYLQYETTKNPFYINEAIRIYKLTDRLLERIKISQLELQSKLFWRQIAHPFYEHAIAACITSGNTEDAFYFFERSRATLLYDQIKEQMGLNGTDISRLAELVTKTNDALKKLSGLNTDSFAFKRIQAEVSSLNDKKNNLLQQIKKRNPLYFNNFLDSSFTSLYETRHNILTDKTLVEIFAGDSSVYSMIVTAKNIFFNKIDKPAYDSTINECIAYMSDYTLANNMDQFDAFAKKSGRLYRLIFQDKNLPEGRVIISTDGRYFPFEALVTGMDHNTPIYFLQNHPISYTYSARYLMSQFSGKTSHVPDDFLGIAPVTFPVSDRLPSLPGSDIAVAKLATLFKTAETTLNENATRENFLANFGHYQVIQLYSHSSDSSIRDEPVIYFADKPLYLSDLGNIKTPATKLIILSACETGRGHFYQGEGVFSFNRAFAALGVPSCINNLWAVGNESTYKITEMFHHYLSNGLPIDIALQKAKLEFMKATSKRPPFYWAATILAGRTDAIRYRQESGYQTMLIFTAIITAALLLLLLLYISYKKKRTFLAGYR